MGLIRVSDDAEKRIKEMTNGRTVTATVDALLAGGGDFSNRLDKMATYLEEKFSHLESLIEDTTVDRLARPTRPTRGVRVPVEWEVARGLFFEYLPDDAPEYATKNTRYEIGQADDEFPVFIEDDKLWSEDFYNHKQLILTISPRVKEYLEAHGILLS